MGPRVKHEGDGKYQIGLPASDREPTHDVWAAIAEIIDQFQPDECWNYITNAGYGPRKPEMF